MNNFPAAMHRNKGRLSPDAASSKRPPWLPSGFHHGALVRGMAGTVSPSNRVTLGVIGLGIRGVGNMRAFRGNPDVHVLAVCDVHETQRLRGKQTVDQLYGDRQLRGL